MAFLQQPLAYYYVDDFNRANNTSLGSEWRMDLTGSRIVSNAAQSRTVSSNTGRQAAGWQTFIGGNYGTNGRYLSDNQVVRAQLKAPATSTAANNFTVLYLAGTDAFGVTGSYLVAFAMSTGSGCAIITQSGAPSGSGGAIGSSGGSNQRVVTATNIAVTDFVQFQRQGNLFTAFKNGSAILQWEDTGGVVPKGLNARRWGFCQEANYPIFQSQFSSPGVDSIEAYDIRF